MSTTPPVLDADLTAGLRRLKLAAMRQLAPELLTTAKTQRWTPEEVLRALVEAEIAARDASNERARIKAAAFPVLKTVEEFDLAASSIPAPTWGVRYLTAADLVETLYRGLADNTVGKVIEALLRNDVVLVDEIGFAPLDDTGAQLLFRFVAAAYERRSLGIASHHSFEDWGRFLPEHTTAVSMLDRLLHHATTVVTNGQSYRMREARRVGTFTWPKPGTSKWPLTEVAHSHRGVTGSNESWTEILAVFQSGMSTEEVREHVDQLVAARLCDALAQLDRMAQARSHLQIIQDGSRWAWWTRLRLAALGLADHGPATARAATERVGAAVTSFTVVGLLVAIVGVVLGAFVESNVPEVTGALSLGATYGALAGMILGVGQLYSRTKATLVDTPAAWRHLVLTWVGVTLLAPAAILSIWIVLHWGELEQSWKNDYSRYWRISKYDYNSAYGSAGANSLRSTAVDGSSGRALARSCTAARGACVGNAHDSRVVLLGYRHRAWGDRARSESGPVAAVCR